MQKNEDFFYADVDEKCKVIFSNVNIFSKDEMKKKRQLQGFSTTIFQIQSKRERKKNSTATLFKMGLYFLESQANDLNEFIKNSNEK